MPSITHTCVSSIVVSEEVRLRRVPRYATILPFGDQIGRYSALGVSVSRRTSPLAACAAKTS